MTPWMMVALVTAALWLALGAAGPANAVEAEQAFAKGTKILGLQANGGVQNNIQDEPQTSGIDFIGVQPRFSYLPLEPFGSSWYRAAVEPGIEGWVQYYMHPQTAVAGGLKASLRVHAIGLGPVIPYLEAAAGAGGTSLDIRESRSRFTFIVETGLGASVFVAPGVALNAGYRLQHVSNGDTSRPNRGYNANTGIVGVSFFFH
jgi:Lipid A 3-O-deacylase (PagL)